MNTKVLKQVDARYVRWTAKAPLHSIAAVLMVLGALACAGCESLRFAPSQEQKRNAWLHNRTALVTAETARAEDSSAKLRALTQLSELQSRAFTADYGLPREFPPVETAEDILAEANWQLAQTAVAQSAQRPDPWQLTDAALEIGIGVCSVLGGVYAAKVSRFLKDAKAKSQALQEVVAGNELFKKGNGDQAGAFKAAHAHQSGQTRRIVAQIRTGA